MKPILVVALIATLAFSGCTTSTGTKSLDVRDVIEPFTTYTWPPMIVTDGQGKILPDHPLLADPDSLPYYVQQLQEARGGEPNIGITKKGNVFITALDDILKSEDKGKTWKVATTMRSPLYGTSVDYWSTGDPMLWVDPDTSRVFASHLGSCTYLAWSDDEGATWSENYKACLTPSIDHQKVATARWGPKSVPPPVKPYPNVVYICYNKGLAGLVLSDQTQGTWCMVSLDGGRTIDYERQILPVVEHCANINGHPAHYPDGTVIVPIGLGWDPRCHRPVAVSYSEDNGLTWTPRYLPTKNRMVEIDPDITVTPNGVAYMLYRDESQVVHLVRSKDKFQTWEGPWRVAPADHTKSVYTVITSGDDGRIALAYVGTKTPQADGTDPSDVVQSTQWHLYVSTVFDAEAAEPVFLTQQVTPTEDPVQTGCVWLRGGGGGPMQCRNMYDFIDMHHDAEGRSYIGFTDGCTPRNGCTANREGLGQSRDSQSAVAVQVRGPSLYKEVGLLPVLEGYEHPLPLPT